MSNDEIGRRSRWMIRVMEWDDPRARYPNLFYEGMPRRILAFDRVVGRLRIGDLLAVYHPASQRHPERAEKFLGLSRVVGLSLADQSGFGWIDLETAHRFDPPLALSQQPRRVFLCCDPGWPGLEVDLFREVFDAAVAAGFRPREDESEAAKAAEPAEELATAAGPVPGRAEEHREAAEDEETPTEEIEVGPTVEEGEAPSSAAATAVEPGTEGRAFAGVDYSGDMRDPRDATWLAVTELRGDRLAVTRLEPTGRHGLQGYLRDPGRLLMNVEAIGLDFPFGLPVAFAEAILGGPYPEEGWWALVRKMESLTRPAYLVAIQEFRDAEGEIKRLTDERAGAFSPLHRVNPDLGPMTYHGIRMIGEDRSRFAIRPFESAQGKLLLETYPGAVVRSLGVGPAPGEPGKRNRAIVNALESMEFLPLVIPDSLARQSVNQRDALDAIIAARCAAVAVLTGEVDKSPDELAPGDGDRVRREGWIYGVQEPS